MALKIVRITDLPAVASLSQLTGGAFEVEVLTGPVAGAYVNKQLTYEQLVDAVGTDVLGPGVSLTGAQALLTGGLVRSGALYHITGNWNASPSSENVYVQGLDLARFATTGIAFDGAGNQVAVDVDVAAGTYAPPATGSAYTDEQARAAQLNRVPATTTGPNIVTLTAESARSYGRLTAPVTIDATDAQVGEAANFTLDAAAGAAATLSNAPTGQPFRVLPAGFTYAAGTSYGYSVEVKLDCVEVLIYPV